VALIGTALVAVGAASTTDFASTGAVATGAVVWALGDIEGVTTAGLESVVGVLTVVALGLVVATDDVFTERFEVVVREEVSRGLFLGRVVVGFVVTGCVVVTLAVAARLEVVRVLVAAGRSVVV